MNPSDPITITSLEQIDMHAEKAGIGSRLLAGFLDMLLLSVFLIIFIFFFFVFSSHETLGPIGQALIVLSSFSLYFGYHTIFEVLRRGQTPGKRAMGLRVITDSGQPITWKTSFMRNIARLADSQPGSSYLLGGLVMGFHKKGKRMGDIAAGTLVIREPKKAPSQTSLQTMVQLKMAHGVISSKTLGLIDNYWKRRKHFEKKTRESLSYKLSNPLMAVCGIDQEHLNDLEKREAFLEKLLKRAKDEAKLAHVDSEKWEHFEKKISKYRQHMPDSLTENELEDVLEGYRHVVGDLHRARSVGANEETLHYLNHLVFLGNEFLYRHYDKEKQGERVTFFVRFPQAVRRAWKAMALSALFFSLPALISYVAIQEDPKWAEELVSTEFQSFHPADEDKLHETPPLMRPLSTSFYISNNVQVSFLAFAGGLTLGVMTFFVLVYNGISLGSVLSWLTYQGFERAFWGWIMPHGATELLAIILSGGAGLLLADALLQPGSLKRMEALKRAAKEAVTIEIGVMGMLGIAGVIEAWVAPSGLAFSFRILIFIASVIGWGAYFLKTGTSRKLG